MYKNRKLAKFLVSAAPVLCILGVALMLRFVGISQWSMCDDEEASLCYSQNLDRAFPRFFPLFFVMLRGLFHFTGISITAGRCLAAAFSVAGIGIIYVGVRKLMSREIALLASFLLAINIGHVFWGQAVRYYSLVFALEFLSLYFFIYAFHACKLLYLIPSSLFLFLATTSHSSAVLIVPVYVAFLVLSLLYKERAAHYNLRNYIFAGFAILFGSSFFLWNSFIVHRTMSEIIVPSAMDPVHVLLTVVAYIGFPLVVLGLAAPVYLRPHNRHLVLFFALVATVPVLEIIIIARNTSVTWYHAFIALAGFSVLASFSLASLYQGGWRKLSVSAAALSTLFYALLLVPYYTTSHGFRPLWKEASLYLKRLAPISTDAEENPPVFATSPGVVSYYLGVPPAETMNHILAKQLDFRLPEGEQPPGRWLLIESNYFTKDYFSEEFTRWFKGQCALRQRFSSTLGPIDRWTVNVYYCGGSSGKSE